MELKRTANKEKQDFNIRLPSIANTYQNEPRFQTVENLSRNYARVGQQKYADPFAYKQRHLDWNYDGRILNIFRTLQANATKNFPEVITPTPLKVVGYY